MCFYINTMKENDIKGNFSFIFKEVLIKKESIDCFIT